MKKQYSAPTIKVVTLLTPLLMAAMSGSVGTGNNSVGNNTPDLANRGRGDWDYIW